MTARVLESQKENERDREIECEYVQRLQHFHPFSSYPPFLHLLTY